MLQRPTSLGNAIVCVEKADQALYVLRDIVIWVFIATVGAMVVVATFNMLIFSVLVAFRIVGIVGFRAIILVNVVVNVMALVVLGGRFGNWQPKQFHLFSSSDSGHPYKGPAPMDLDMA